MRPLFLRHRNRRQRAHGDSLARYAQEIEGTSELDSLQRRVLWTGVALGLAFRLFVYGFLIAVPFRFPTLFKQLYVLHWGMAFFAPFWVPFVGGFLIAYFWRRLPAQEHSGAIRVNSALLLLIAFVATAATLGVWPAFLAIVLVYVDSGMCASGNEQGVKFWDSRLGKRFRSDFSTPDETV